MFDVSTNEGDHEIEIIALDIHTNIIQEDCPVLVYGRPGTHVGFENATEAWVLLVNATVECLGFDERTSIPSSLFQETPIIRGGESYAFYTQMPNFNIRYINGVKVGAIYSSNDFSTYTKERSEVGHHGVVGKHESRNGVSDLDLVGDRAVV